MLGGSVGNRWEFFYFIVPRSPSWCAAYQGPGLTQLPLLSPLYTRTHAHTHTHTHTHAPPRPHQAHTNTHTHTHNHTQSVCTFRLSHPLVPPHYAPILVSN